VDEHYSIGTSESENAVGRLRETSIALLIQANLPAKFWPCAIQHSTLLVNYTSRSRANPKLTVYELPTRADMSKIPPFGAYCKVHRARDQRQGNLDLPSTPRIFVGMGIYQKTLGFMVMDTTINNLSSPASYMAKAHARDASRRVHWAQTRALFREYWFCPAPRSA